MEAVRFCPAVGLALNADNATAGIVHVLALVRYVPDNVGADRRQSLLQHFDSSFQRLLLRLLPDRYEIAVSEYRPLPVLCFALAQRSCVLCNFTANLHPSKSRG